MTFFIIPILPLKSLSTKKSNQLCIKKIQNFWMTFFIIPILLLKSLPTKKVTNYV
jgi:hypothetical protein